MSGFSIFGESTLILVDDVEVPVRNGEYHTWGAQPTRYGIESGAAASDHIVELPDAVEITWVVGNAEDEGAVMGTTAGAVMQSLHEAMKRRELYDVVTQHMLYTSMAFVDARIDHISPYTGQITGRVAFEHIPQLKLERIQLPESSIGDGRKKSASTQVDGGRVDTKKPTEPQRKSVLAQVFGGSGG